MPLTRRRWIVLHVVAILLIVYVSSYFYLSRLRWHQYRALRLPGFLYVAPESLANDADERWRMRHGSMALVYYPINRIDRDYFGGPAPLACLLTGVRSKK